MRENEKATVRKEIMANELADADENSKSFRLQIRVASQFLPMPPLALSTTVARRFQRLATGLDHPVSSIHEAVEHLGFVQIDPINVCGRMHDHILRNRVAGYTEGGLMQAMHAPGRRRLFEQHLPDSSNLAALPVAAWPHLQRVMQARASRDSLWSGRLSPEESTLAKRLLAQMAETGPVASNTVESDRKEKQHAWDSTTLAKSTLQKLFFHGKVLIAARDGIRRLYDLPERILPAETLRRLAPSAEETSRWLAELKLRQRRLAMLTTAEQRLVEHCALPVAIEGLPKLKLWLLSEDLPLLEIAATTESPREPQLLAPLDPLIYDRGVTEQLWGYHYRWEVYTPPAKRVRGYYALPLLEKITLTGHADLKADRTAGVLQVVGQAGRSARKAATSLASFLGLQLAFPRF
jgi:uncharacterized protein